MSKMGISTIQSYQGAQIFEALGISESVVNKYFTGTTTRIAVWVLSISKRKCFKTRRGF